MSVPNSTYHSANMYTSKGVHGTAHDTTADEMYDAYIRETDPVKAEQLWHDFRAYVDSLYICYSIAEIEGKVPVAPTLGKWQFPADRAQIFTQDIYPYIQHPD